MCGRTGPETAYGGCRLDALLLISSEFSGLEGVSSMSKHPCKVRLQRRRGEIIVDLMVPKSGSGWYVRESVNLGALTMRDAVLELGKADLTAAPLLKAVVIPVSA